MNAHIDSKGVYSDTLTTESNVGNKRKAAAETAAFSVGITSYEIKQPVADFGKLILEFAVLNESSNPQKIAKFIQEVGDFLIEKGYAESSSLKS